MISQPVFSIFPCSPLPSATWRTPGLSTPWCCLPTSSSLCLVFFPLSLCLARWFWPDLINVDFIPKLKNEFLDQLFVGSDAQYSFKRCSFTRDMQGLVPVFEWWKYVPQVSAITGYAEKRTDRITTKSTWYFKRKSSAYHTIILISSTRWTKRLVKANFFNSRLTISNCDNT